MKRKIPVMILIAVALSGLWLANARGDADDAKPAAKKEAAPEPRIKQDTNGNTTIKLDEETLKRVALKIEPLAATNLSPQMKAFGRVLDPAPLAALLTEVASAQSAYAASSNELARLQTLSASGNASARVVQTAQAAAQRDQLTLQSARDRLALSWGKVIAEQNDLPTFIQSLTSLDAALVRVDLAAGERLEAMPAAAHVAPLSGSMVSAQVLGAAMAVDPQTQGQGFMLLIKPNLSHFLPGETVTASLQVPGDAIAGIIVPRGAVVRLEGSGWVYVSGAGGIFTRKAVALDCPVDAGWFVTNGVAANDQVVVGGAQSLLSEELKAATGPPD